MARCRQRLWVLLALVLVASAPASAGEPNKLSKTEVGAGWIALFDGETTFGWSAVGDAKWQATGGALACEADKTGWLATTTEFADFVLSLEYRLPEKGNSHIAFRRTRDGEGPALAIGEDAPLLSTKQPRFKPNTWQRAVIAVRGERLMAMLDGAKWFDSTDKKFPTPLKKFRRGVVALAADGTKAEFRSVFLQPLGLKPIFNGKDLTGWKVHPGRKSVYSVTPAGELNVKNGNGDIQTTGTWGDFCLQLEIISNGEHLNSGVFFRAIPGQFWQGYESQIRNQWKDDDRTKPVDYGTGGIYRRQPARRVVATDREWFSKTIIAHGRHLAVWVNGCQVSDWTDRRPLHDNPRKGCRLAPGAISFQGHDPTTDLSFRNIKIAEYPRPKE